MESRETPSRLRSRQPDPGRSGKMRQIVCVVLACHFIGLSFFCSDFYARFHPPKKEIPFKVKIGAATPSHGPVVGPPERRRPRPEPPAPPAPPKPKPEPPAPKPKPKPKPVKPKPEPPAPKSKPKSKPVKPKPEPPAPKAKPAKTKPKQKPVKPRTATKPTPEPAAPPSRQPSRVEREQREVYRPPAGSNNFNPNVPIGSRDAAQVYAPKPDHRTPQGGLTPDDEAYNRRLMLFIKDRWHPPASIQLQHDLPSPTIEIEIDGAGNVRASKLLTPSGNRAMDDSARRLLKVLDRLPTPPKGLPRTLQIVLKAEE